MAKQNIQKALKDLQDTIVGKVPLPNEQVDQTLRTLRIAPACGARRERHQGRLHRRFDNIWLRVAGSRDGELPCPAAETSRREVSREIRSA